MTGDKDSKKKVREGKRHGKRMREKDNERVKSLKKTYIKTTTCNFRWFKVFFDQINSLTDVGYCVTHPQNLFVYFVYYESIKRELSKRLTLFYYQAFPVKQFFSPAFSGLKNEGSGVMVCVLQRSSAIRGKEGTGKWGWWGASAMTVLFGAGLAVVSYPPYGAGLVVNCETYDTEHR